LYLLQEHHLPRLLDFFLIHAVVDLLQQGGLHAHLQKRPEQGDQDVVRRVLDHQAHVVLHLGEEFPAVLGVLEELGLHEEELQDLGQIDGFEVVDGLDFLEQQLAKLRVGQPCLERVVEGLESLVDGEGARREFLQYLLNHLLVLVLDLQESAQSHEQGLAREALDVDQDLFAESGVGNVARTSLVEGASLEERVGEEVVFAESLGVQAAQTEEQPAHAGVRGRVQPQHLLLDLLVEPLQEELVEDQELLQEDAAVRELLDILCVRSDSSRKSRARTAPRSF